ncbi:MAG: thiamine-phosphate kinase [Desulfuromonadales bacterium C00003096]|jgi:thiamine-monophosphate kinase|nr:MAG: thiamine-phosphate kinase [Desulfuromonadales bacterium C00003096]
MKLADLGEFGFIERIQRAVARTSGNGVRLGIGDDCAVLELPPGQVLLTSTDLLIEEVHFLSDWSDWRALGGKCVSVNVSDVAAMGGSPRHLYLGLAIPAMMAMEDLDAFLEGFLAAASGYGAVLVGGDTCRSPGPLMISVTVEGAAPTDQVVTRSGARPGDAIYVSGTLGDSALALQRLQSGLPMADELAHRHHQPQARVGLGRALAAAQLPSAMIDVSDGVLADLGHILDASAVGARLEQALFPLSKEFSQALVEEPAFFELALSGGEDYELLFTLPADKEQMLADLVAEVPITRIGTVTAAEQGLLLVDEAGKVRPARAKGYNHFRG